MFQKRYITQLEEWHEFVIRDHKTAIHIYRVLIDCYAVYLTQLLQHHDIAIRHHDAVIQL